ncbi:MAG: phosphoribosylformylglycinamidine synthase subunit PurL [Candidatus Dormibacteria bacterium]
MIAVSEAALREVALTPDEYREICSRLGREPNRVELGIFGAMWSEHCSYKTSRSLLGRLPTTGAAVVQGPGENAGAVRINDQQAVVFKVESHNHPSAIEPHEGAATGVGGILRDVFVMGARPVAILDSLRFGPPGTASNRRLFSGVVSGISSYGNCVGVPTVAGEVYFEDCYTQNPLVNAMCVGVVRISELRRAAPDGPGNLVIIAGADTGRDGIHGATFASVELDEDSHTRRPAVQVGNPFLEKCLMEVSLELAHEPFVTAIQDLGAAGLTSSAVECASRGGLGIELSIDRVPRRESGMGAYEVMLSESQERMLIFVRPGTEASVQQRLERWGLHSAVIGSTTDDGVLRVLDNGRIECEIPVELLTDGVPLRQPASSVPAGLARTQALDIEGLPARDPGRALLDLLASPNLCSRRSIFRRYDHQVGNDTVVRPGGDAAVLRIRESGQGIAVSIDGNGRYCHLDPRTGGGIAVAEAARNVVATGARPLAVTDCLNFASPDRPEVYWQLEQCVDGIAEACRALHVPVISGNVSLYNETGEVGIYPTPVIGMVGLMDDVNARLEAGFQAAGDFVMLMGINRNELGGSEYLRVCHGLVAGMPPQLHLDEEARVQEVVLAANRQRILRSAHDLSDGGLAVALAECCLLSGLGVRCSTIPHEGLRQDALLFGETQSRFIVTVAPRSVPALQAIARRHSVPVQMLGVVGGASLSVEGMFEVPLTSLYSAWDRSPIS